MSGLAKRLALTFLVGGASGIVGQALIVLYSSLGLEGLALPMAVLLTFGVFGLVMILTRVSTKMEKLGISALLIVFYGLSIAMAQAYGTMRSSGLSFARSFIGTWKFFAIALIPGIAIAVITGLIVGIIAV